MGNRFDFLSPLEAARISTDIADLFLDTQVRRAVTWYYLERNISTPTSWGFSGNVTATEATDAAFAVRGHVRDSASNEIEVGRYRYLIPATDLTSGTPDTNDILRDGSDDLRVNAVRLDTLSKIYVVEVTKPVVGGG